MNKGALQDIEQYAIKPAAQVAPRSVRNEFTTDEDKRLFEFATKQKCMGRAILGLEIYKDFASRPEVSHVTHARDGRCQMKVLELMMLVLGTEWSSHGPVLARALDSSRWSLEGEEAGIECDRGREFCRRDDAGDSCYPR